MIRIIRYSSQYKFLWDSFIESSKNGTFLFYRDYMDYHSNRFTDNSLIFFYKNKPLALLPAHRKSSTLYSHNGLTYGGLILSFYTRTEHVISIFEILKEYMLSENIFSLYYKPIPHIYHQFPSEEDLYALFLNKAKLVSRRVSSSLYLQEKNKLQFSTLRKRKIKQSLQYNLRMLQDNNWVEFWLVLENNLRDRYSTMPVHSLSEIILLKKLYPRNIQLYNIYHEDKVIAGCVIYRVGSVAHMQYIASNEYARKVGAVDYLISSIISEINKDIKVVDFGTSMLEDNIQLQTGLLEQKEGFGARAILYDTYLLELKNN